MREQAMYNPLKFRLITLLVPLLLVACQASTIDTPGQTGRPPIDQINADMQLAIDNNQHQQSPHVNGLSKEVANALLPDLNWQTNTIDTLPQFDVAAEDMPARTFFLGLVDDSPYNIIVDPAITENVNLHLKQVTIPQVLDALQQSYGFQYTIEHYGIYVTKGKIETRTFKVNYINLIRSGNSHTEVSSGELTQHTESTDINTSTSTSTSQNTPSSQVSTSSQSDFWTTLSDTLHALIGDTPETKVVINRAAGLVIVRANTAVLNQIAKYLDDVQSIMNQQVILEAKVLEVELSKGYQAGIDWNILDMSQTFSNNIISDDLGLFDSIFTLDMSANDGAFSAVVSLLGTQGNVQTLSNPRISTLNNQQAIIKVGHDEYFITDVSSTSTSNGVGTDNTQDVTLTPFFSGIALNVTPEISNNNDVILHIHPMISKVVDHTIEYTINGDDQSIPSALSKIKETDNIVRAKNGQVVVIGGLMENEAAEYLGTTPYASEVPFLGSLFRRTSQTSTNSELVILLRPTIVNNTSTHEQLQSISQRFKSLNAGYHKGPYPERFGNLGEYTE
jgi:MSHA biogenesis protein MshL